MKKLFIMALAAIFAANISAQGAKVEKSEKAEVKSECKKDHKECKHGKGECKKSFEERIEMEIQFLSNELYLDSVQAEKFAKTYREYKKAQMELKKEFKKKFSKNLNDRQVEAVLRFPAPKHGKGGCPQQCQGECKHKKGDFEHKDGHKHGHRASRSE